MSEHPELREALRDVVWSNVAFARTFDANSAAMLADALLAGPVGKLQAELEAAAIVFERAQLYAHACGLYPGGFQMDTYVAIVEMLGCNDETINLLQDLLREAHVWGTGIVDMLHLYDDYESAYPADADLLVRIGEALNGQLADPERIRREAIGAWVLGCTTFDNGVYKLVQTADGDTWLYASFMLDAALAAGESAVTGEAT